MPHNLRTSSIHALQRPVVHTIAHQFSFFPHTIALWNALPPSVHASSNRLWMLSAYVLNPLQVFKFDLAEFDSTVYH